MTATYTPRDGWTVPCPECEGTGGFAGHDHSDYFGGYMAIQSDCDHCDATGRVEAESDDFNGLTAMIGNELVDIHNDGAVLYRCDDDTPVDAADLRPARELVA